MTQFYHRRARLPENTTSRRATSTSPTWSPSSLRQALVHGPHCKRLSSPSFHLPAQETSTWPGRIFALQVRAHVLQQWDTSRGSSSEACVIVCDEHMTRAAPLALCSSVSAQSGSRDDFKATPVRRPSTLLPRCALALNPPSAQIPHS